MLRKQNTQHTYTGLLQDAEEICILCRKRFENENDKVKPGAKGLAGINNASKKRQDNIVAVEGDLVHAQCRRAYTNPHMIKQSSKSSQTDQSPKSPIKKRLRTESPSYSSVSQCLFCAKGEKWTQRNGLKHCEKLVSVRTTEFQETISQCCRSRNDAWGKEVTARLEYMQDCIAFEVVYHNVCSVNFRTGKPLPSMFHSEEPSKKRLRFSAGRPEDQTCVTAFQEVVSFLENNDNENVTVRQLVEMMDDVLSQSVDENAKRKAYSVPYMKKKLLQHFGDSVIIADADGKPDVVFHRKTASQILSEFHAQQKKTSCQDESNLLIKTVAALLRSEMMDMVFDKNVYPDSGEMSLDSQIEFLPLSFQTLLSEVIRGKKTDLKIASIGQCIIQAARPNTCIAPLQICLAVQMHKAYASRSLIDTLNKMGFCSSYSEVLRFLANAAASQGLDLPEVTEEKTLQFVADNVDHNTATLDGRNTFHGMGMIAVITPGLYKPRKIPRRKVSISEVAAIGKIGIHFYRYVQIALDNLASATARLIIVHLQAFRSHYFDYQGSLLLEPLLVATFTSSFFLVLHATYFLNLLSHLGHVFTSHFTPEKFLSMKLTLRENKPNQESYTG